MRTLIASIALVCGSAHAAPITCLPKQLGGTATRAVVVSNSKGDFAAWYCASEQMPTLVVCLKSTCSLVGSKRAAAALLSNPSTAGLTEALKPYARNPYTDPELRAVWTPHIDQIAALIGQ